MTDAFGPYELAPGATTVFADPFEIDAGLWECLKADPGEVQRKTTNADPLVANAAKRQLIEAVRAAFRLSPFDPATGQGATAAHCMTVWNQWADYGSKKNGSAAPASISTPPGLSLLPAGRSLAPESGSDSGCTSDG